MKRAFSGNVRNKPKWSLRKRIGAWVTAGVASALIASGVSHLASSKRAALHVEKPRPALLEGVQKATEQRAAKEAAEKKAKNLRKQVSQIASIYGLRMRSNVDASLLGRAQEFCEKQGISMGVLFRTLEQTKPTVVNREVMVSTLKDMSLAEANRARIIYRIQVWRSELPSAQRKRLEQVLTRPNTLTRVRETVE
jgi:hypothetical protein